MWVTLIMMLISYFLQKSSGKTNTQAALGAAAVGAGTYYVATQTDWGKTNLSDLNDSIADAAGFGYINSEGQQVQNGVPVLDANGEQVLGVNGQPIYEDPLSPVPRDSSGNPVRQSDGSISGQLINGAYGVLKSWGGAGTAAVIGTTSVAASEGGVAGFISKNALWIVGGLAAVLLLRS